MVDRLLSSRHYGERWGRYWLDLARYSDDKLNSTQDEPYPNAHRYRDWVIDALNNDMPYDVFVKAQIAGDLLPEKDRLAAGTGFYSLSPEFQDDRVDATTRGFLALTVACARCHDHKFDPIPTRDYYSLQGVFASSEKDELPLAPGDRVKAWKEHKERIEKAEEEIKEFLKSQATALAEVLAARTSDYLLERETETLDQEILERWRAFVKLKHDYPFLKPWQDAVARQAPRAELEKIAAEIQEQAVAVQTERKKIEETNLIRLGGSKKRGDLAAADLLSLERDKYFFWRQLYGENKIDDNLDSGVLYLKEKKLERFLAGPFGAHLGRLRASLETLKKTLPEQYPFLHTMKDSAKPHNVKIQIRGNRETLGDEAPRQFLTSLSGGAPKPFAQGSGRLELAEAIANPANPLTARVMVNRVWLGHFGTGLVRTPSNFGRLGEQPSHPELLDYLAGRLMDQGWSLKKLHREIVLSAVYQLSSAPREDNMRADAANRHLWRANRRRLDFEALRDSLLAAGGSLDATAGGKPVPLTAADNHRRTVYGFVSRRRLDNNFLLFDFPNPNATSEYREVTDTALQRLYFLNSTLVEAQSKALAKRLENAAPENPARIREAYRILFGREPGKTEVEIGTGFLAASRNAWPRYTQALMASNEFLFID